MKKKWEIKNLGEICEVLDSKRKPITKKNRIEGEYPYYGATGILSYVNNYIFNEKLVLIGEDGAKWASGDNTSFIAEGKYWVNNHAHVIRPSRDKVIDEWIVYFLNFSDLSKYISGMTVPKLNQEKMRSITVPIPQLAEQQRIVAILDKAFSAIATAKEYAERNLQNSKELFQSYLQNVFADKGEGWEEKKLGEVLQKTETINPKKNPNKEFIYIDVSSVNKENLTIEITSLIIGKDAPSRAKKLIKTGDVIFATVRPTLRRIAIIPEKFNEQVCSTGYFVLRTKKHFDNKLVFYFLQTNGFNEKMEKLQKGASYPAVTDTEVRSQIIPYPKSLTEQKRIVAKLDALSEQTKNLETIYRRKIADLEELKKSILQKAFDGEL
jgi:type I restriction enzyme, S subunit